MFLCQFEWQHSAWTRVPMACIPVWVMPGICAVNEAGSLEQPLQHEQHCPNPAITAVA